MSRRVSRREALRRIAAAPALGAIAWSTAQAERAAHHVRALAEGAQGAPYQPKFFSPHEWLTVRLLADHVIPSDARSGSATDAKVPEFIDWILADSEASPASRTAMRGGLAWLDLACEDRFAATFIDCTDTQRRTVLDAIAFPAKATPEMSQGAAFFTRFRDLVATGFFSSEMGWKDLRYMGNVAVAEWKGCPPEALTKLGVRYP